MGAHPQHIGGGLSAFLVCLFALVVGGYLIAPALIPHDLTYDVQRLLQLSFLAWLWMLSWRYRQLFFAAWLARPAKKLRWALLCFMALGLASAFRADFVHLSIMDWLYWAVCLASIAFLGSSVISIPRQSLMTLGGILVLVMMFYGVRLLLEILSSGFFVTRVQMTPGFANIRLFADVAVGFIPLASLYYLALQNKRKSRAALALLVMALWVWLLLITEARSALLGLLMGGLVVLFLFGRRAASYLVMLCASLGLAVIGWFAYHPMAWQMDSLFWRSNLMSDSGRFELWHDAFNYGIKSFPLGIGPLMFAADGQARPASPHNIFLTLWAEWGAIAALIFLGVVLYVVGSRLREYASQRVEVPELAAPIVCAALACLVNLLFAGAHIAPLGAMTLIGVLGIFFGYGCRVRPSGEVVQYRRGWLATAAWFLWGGMIIGLVFLALPYFNIAHFSIELCVEQTGRALVSPRFWYQGRLDCGVN